MVTPSEGRYTRQSRKRVETDTKGMLMGGQKKMDKALAQDDIT
jgi:hypothetical protein